MVKFLLIRFSSIGDIVLTTPVIRHLKSQVPHAEIHFLTKEAYAGLLEANPHVDHIHAYKGHMSESIRLLKELNFDYIIDLHHNTRTARIKQGLKRMDFTVRKLNWQKWLMVNFKINRLPELHMVDRNLQTIGHFVDEWDESGLDYYIPEKHQVDLSTLPEAFRKGYLGLVIGAQHATKKLPRELLIQLCSQLDMPVVILGGPGDRPQGDAIVDALPEKALYNSCGKYSIHQSASLVEQASLIISHDTGLMHMAAAFGKTVFSIWGNTIPEFGMSPYRASQESRMFEVKDLTCRPCSFRVSVLTQL